MAQQHHASAKPFARRSRRRRTGRRFATLLLAVALVLIVIVGALCAYSALCEKWERRQHPMHYADLIDAASERYGIPASLLYAVVRTESSFDADALSHAGAVGLMQITPATFDWLSSKPDAPEGDNLTDPTVNVAYGAYYLAMLYEEFQSWRIACAAYNAGPNRVRQWLEDDPALSDIPISETATYVVRVERAMQTYASLYSLEVQSFD